MEKTAGVPGRLRAALAPLADRVRLALLYGSVAKQTDTAMSDIDVLVVSDDLTLEEMFAALEDAERDLGRTVSPTLYTSDEFRRRRRSGHPFVTGVLDGPHIVLVGEPAYRALEKTMDKVLQEILRNECLAKARSQNKLVEKRKFNTGIFIATATTDRSSSSRNQVDASST